MRGKRVRGVTRWSRSWMWELGARLYYGDPSCVLAIVERFGKPGWRWAHLALHPPAGVDHWVLVEEAVEMLLRKDSQARATDAAAATLVDVKAQKAWPNLWVHWTQTKWEDDSPRQPSGLTVFVQDGLFKVLLKDNEQGLCLWAAGNGFHAALDAIEAALASPQPDWRVDRRAGGGVARKGKR